MVVSCELFRTVCGVEKRCDVIYIHDMIRVRVFVLCVLGLEECVFALCVL